MHRRPLGRGRWLAIAGAVLILLGSVPPWYAVGGGSGLPETTLNAFGGSGILVFLAALAVLALAALPYATERPVALDRPLSFGLCLVLALIGLGLWPLGLLGEDLGGLLPTRAPGLWIAALGVVILARGAFEINQEPPHR
jgi:hypothetical protein